MRRVIYKFELVFFFNLDIERRRYFRENKDNKML